MQPFLTVFNIYVPKLAELKSQSSKPLSKHAFFKFSPRAKDSEFCFLYEYPEAFFFCLEGGAITPATEVLCTKWFFVSFPLALKMGGISGSKKFVWETFLQGILPHKNSLFPPKISPTISPPSVQGGGQMTQIGDNQRENGPVTKKWFGFETFSRRKGHGKKPETDHRIPPPGFIEGIFSKKKLEKIAFQPKFQFDRNP